MKALISSWAGVKPFLFKRKITSVAKLSSLAAEPNERISAKSLFKILKRLDMILRP